MTVKGKSSISKNGMPQRVDDLERIAFLELMLLSTVPMALKAAALLDVPQILYKAGEGALLSAKEIADCFPLQNPANANYLERILRLLASCNVFTELVIEAEGKMERRYGLTPICKYFLKDRKGGSLAPYLLLRHDNLMFQSMHHLHDVVLEGREPFTQAHGESLFEFLEGHPNENTLFNTAMSNLSQIYLSAVLDNYTGFKGVKRLVDVGGGTGSALSMIVAKYPSIQGINFDLPHVVVDAPFYPGVDHVGGNMFESIPSSDAIYMKNILHNWSDESCQKILRNCYDALEDNGKVILVEFLLPAPDECRQKARIALSFDVIMMAQFLGRERTEREYHSLFKAAGFSDCHAVLFVDCMAVLEAHKSKVPAASMLITPNGCCLHDNADLF
ncbi:hypothetical protein O6H91_17G050700 [Diphasiastrum complanatum]|uniref:Uncharacterized protein n=1 Tax=Diphasiastrum complanatum TaxID=34168 RepID=A0ACC2B7T2_DIPCM|nr:hypothetical protein O6H91_17G050700 [Diphasiastrum complanatum]